MTLEVSISDKDLQQIKESVLKNHGLDLSYFKPAFLARRIHVRMKMLNMRNSSEYVNFLNSKPNEIGSLYDSLSINVTKFFRDKQVWQFFMQKVIPNLLEVIKPTDTIRIWSCGCASGEEPYSLAIMFNEALKNTDHKFKILATDINLNSLREARTGVYTNDNLKNLESFNVGDITTFPATYLDVVFCRNLLIYYGKDAQDLIFKKFYTVLKQNRFLVLGMDETLWGHKLQNSFVPISAKDRIYQKKLPTETLSELITGQ